jgi:phospholipid/cholesterol/gamma-HCH transport system permease protein
MSSAEAEAVRLQAARASVAVARLDERSVVLTFAGRWTIDAVLPSLHTVLSQIAAFETPGTAVERVILDARGLEDWDSEFLVYLRKLGVDLAKLDVTVDPSGLPDGVRRLLAMASAVPAVSRRQPPEHDTLLDRVGMAVQKLADEVRAFVDFLGELVIATVRLLRGRARFPTADFALVLQDSGIRALPIVALIAVLIGLIMAFVGAVQLTQFGAGIFTADMVAIAMLREMGAVMTAIIMAGRTGAAYAAELATMQVNEEIDALGTLGIDPVEYLVLPRVLGLTLMMPLLCLYADLLGILGGAVIGLTILDIPLLEYWTRTINATGFTNLTIGIVKAMVFGGLIGLAGCLRGLTAGRSAAAVGMATTSAVVTAIVMIVVFDGLFAVVLNFFGV